MRLKINTRRFQNVDEISSSMINLEDKNHEEVITESRKLEIKNSNLSYEL